MKTLYATKEPAQPEKHYTLTRKLIRWCLFKWQNQSEIHMSRCILQNCLRKTLPDTDKCDFASGLQLVIWPFSLGDRSEWVRGWPLHLLTHLNPSLWAFHSWHIRLWTRSAQDTPSEIHCSVFLFKTRHLNSIILSSCSRNAGPLATRLRRDHARSYESLLL